jgi:hypothetical protein
MPLWMISLTAYFAIGLTLAFVGSAARERRREQRKIELDTRNPSRWKIRAFAFAKITGIVLLWPYLAVSAARSAKTPMSAWDALQGIPAFQEQQQLHKAMSRLCEEGVDADELPNGRGDFGWVPTNPIPCNTVFGSTVYLSRLRTPDGAKVVYRRVGSFTSDVSPRPIDGYDLSHPEGHKLATVFISPYQKRNSNKSPRGFELVPVTSG